MPQAARLKRTIQSTPLYPVYLRIVRAFRRFAPASHLVPPLHHYLLLKPVPFGIWFHARRLAFQLRGHGVRTIAPDAVGGDSHIMTQVIPHNAWQVGNIARLRTERLINILRSVGGLDAASAKILDIGPRNETELLLFHLYGFRMDNITSVDLFSYTPRIEVMDMHDLKFPDRSFDVTYCAYTLRYSDNLDRACAEIVRCTKHGGLVAVIFVTEADQSKERGAFVGTPLSGGIDELLARFGDDIAEVYWREDYRVHHDGAPGTKICSTIFRVR